VQRLIDAGADLDEQDRMGHTPLHVAAGSEEPGSGESRQARLRAPLRVRRRE